MIEKQLPRDLDAEDSVIGSLLIDGDAIHLVENKLKPSDFYMEANQKLFGACLVLRSRREQIDQITLAQELHRTNQLELCGGAAHLSHLIAICPTSLDIEHYANIVYRLSVSRQFISLGERVIDTGYKSEPDVTQALNSLSGVFNDFRKSVVVYDELVTPKDAANATLDMIDEYNNPKHTMSWGYSDLDNLTSGIYPELIIIGARPGVGKTQIMLDVMENLALRQYRILFCSAEMSIKSLMERKIARELKVDIRRLRHSGLDVELMDKLTELSGIISEQQVYYLPQGASSQDIYNEATKLKENKGLDIVFVDYLQILRDCWQYGKENKSTLVGRASKVLKSLVNDLQIPVICASQLNREIEHRPEDSRKPVLADLRESGDIEQDADVVFLLWRDTENMELKVRNILEIKMAKNRQLGDAPFVKLLWLPDHHRYANMYQPSPELR